MTQLAPGARALIRDEEWLIRRVDPSADGGWLLTCDGISDPDDYTPDGKTKDGTFLVPDGTTIAITVTDDTQPGGLCQVTRTFTAPFARANREEDYRTAWSFFASNEGGACN